MRPSTTIYAKFAKRTIFLNTGLFVVSALSCVQFATGYPIPADAAIIDPAIGYAVAAALIGIGVFGRRANSSGFSPWRDCAPLVIFASAVLLGGVRHPWVWTLFGIGVISSALLLILSNRAGGYDEDADRIFINLRWPF